MGRGGGSERELPRSDVLVEQELPRAGQALVIHQGEAKPEGVLGASIRAADPVSTQMPAPPHHPADIAPAVPGGLGRPLREPANAEQLRPHGQVRPLVRAPLSTGHVLPSPTTEESVVAAGHQLGSVLEQHAVGRLYRPPVVEYLGGHETAVDAAALSAVDAIAGGQLIE